MDDGFLWPPRLTMDAVYGRDSASVLHWRRIVVIWSAKKTRLRTLQRGRQPALQRLGRGRLVVTRMPAAPPVEAVLLVHAGQRC